MDYPKFKVCVRCFTFNQAAYITDALNGFTMQETDFPFVCCIVDNASTDGEPDVISGYLEEHFDFSEGSVACKKETDYAHITYAQHKTNRNCYFAVLYLKENHYSQKKDKLSYLKEWRDLCEYEALCEGDDYWIVPDKLQRQVDFLEANTEYGLCYTKVKRFNQKKQQDMDNWGGKSELFSELIKENTIPTLTVLFRIHWHKLYASAVKPEMHGWLMGDYPLWLYIAAETKIKYIDDIMGVYRVLENSASHSLDENKNFYFGLNGYSIRLFFSNRYNKYRYLVCINRSWYIVRFVIKRIFRQYKKLKYLFVFE